MPEVQQCLSESACAGLCLRKRVATAVYVGGGGGGGGSQGSEKGQAISIKF